MNILYISYPLVDQGAPHQAMSAFYLARNHVLITFIAWGNYTIPKWLSYYAYLKYYLFPKKALFSALQFLVQIFLFWREKPDFVYIQGAQHTPFVIWLPWVKGKSRLIYHTQDYLGPGQHWFYEWCERYFARHADCVICNEPNRARFMASSYKLKQMPEVIRTALPSWWPVPARDQVYRRSLLEQAGLGDIEQPRLIVAGGAYRQDRMSPELVQAFCQLPSNYALVFNYMPVGSTSQLACKEHLAQLGIHDRVLFLDSLPYAELLKLYAACDIGILLYPNNGIGHFYQAPGRLTEYLRCGIPVVASDFPGLELLVMKYNLGSVANPYNPEAIAKAIDHIGRLSDAELDEIRLRLISLATTEFAYEHQAEAVFSRICIFA